ncbi:MAG: hypothetical protein HZB51_24345 [Chloroflexi bacterium]|nr:hypothetical protein [Chloroflexota bacterium]
MLGSTVLEVAIGMVFVFLLTSLVCSGISDRISDVLNWRAKHLENGIRELLMGGDQKLLNQLYNNQVIQSLSTLRAEKLGKTPAMPKVNPDGTLNPKDPTDTPDCFPINIPKRTFVLAVFNALVPDSTGQTTIGGLRTSIENMPDNAMKKELLTLVTGADSTIEQARQNIEQWFNAAEERMTQMYKTNMWKVSLVIGAIVAIIFNIDSAAVASTLWRDPTLRSAVVAQATEYANKEQLPDNASSKALEQIKGLNLPLGWGGLKEGANNYGQCVQSNFLFLAGCYGPVDWVSWEPSPSAVDSGVPVAFPWFTSFFVKLIGWALTAFAGAQGAPFWFDILKKLTDRGPR